MSKQVEIEGTKLEAHVFDGAEHVLMKDWCEARGLDYGKCRRAADKGELEGARKVMDRWAIDANAPVPEFKSTASRSQRFPGTSRVHVYYEGADVLEQLKDMDGVYLWDPAEKQPVGQKSWNAFEGDLPGENDDEEEDDEAESFEADQEDLFGDF
jgi:hypothetical protein